MKQRPSNQLLHVEPTGQPVPAKEVTIDPRPAWLHPEDAVAVFEPLTDDQVSYVQTQLGEAGQSDMRFIITGEPESRGHLDCLDSIHNQLRTSRAGMEASTHRNAKHGDYFGAMGGSAWNPGEFDWTPDPPIQRRQPLRTRCVI